MFLYIILFVFLLIKPELDIILYNEEDTEDELGVKKEMNELREKKKQYKKTMKDKDRDEEIHDHNYPDEPYPQDLKNKADLLDRQKREIIDMREEVKNKLPEPSPENKVNSLLEKLNNFIDDYWY